jgi:hypothetical protein
MYSKKPNPSRAAQVQRNARFNDNSASGGQFGNGNAQFSAGVGTKKMVCPDPFMGRLADPNLKR